MATKAHFDDDRELVIRCQQGDEPAFEELVRKYQQMVLNVVYHNLGGRADVEDVAQEIFAKVYFSLPKFDNRRPFFPWIYRIAVNQCYDELRRARRQRTHTFSELNLQDADTIDRLIKQVETPSDHSQDHPELHKLLHSLLDSLPVQQRMAVVLRDLEEVPYDKIAEILGCSEQATRLKVFRARARLRELIEKTLRKRSRGLQK